MNSTQVLDQYYLRLQVTLFIRNEAGERYPRRASIVAQNTAMGDKLERQVSFQYLLGSLSRVLGLDEGYISGVIAKLRTGSCVTLGGDRSPIVAEPPKLIELGFSPLSFS